MSDSHQRELSASDIARGLKELGIQAGDVLLVHSSLKSLGRVAGGAETLIDGLLAAVEPGGTLMVPTLTGRREDSPAVPPVFDVRHTPGWTGLIPETFRHRPDVRRSLHPTHSVAAKGPQTLHLLKDHLDCDTPCGPGSPYMRMVELNGKVVFIGVTLACCTLLHGVEELAGAAYHMQPEPAMATVIDEHGKSIQRSVRLHSWARGRRFEVLEPVLVREGALRIGRIGQAEVWVLQAKPLVDITLRLLRENPELLCA